MSPEHRVPPFRRIFPLAQLFLCAVILMSRVWWYLIRARVDAILALYARIMNPSKNALSSV